VSTEANHDPDGIPTCVIDFDIVKGARADAEFFATPQLKGTVAGAKQRSSFLVTLSPLHLTTNPYPTLLGGGPSQKWAAETADNHLPYQVPLTLLQAPEGSGYNQVNLIDNYSALCTNKLVITLFPSSGPAVSVNKNNISSVALSFFFDDSGGEERLGTLDLNDPNPTTCTITSGQILLTDTASGSSIRKPLQSALALKLRFPHVKPTLTLTLRNSNCSSGRCDMVATLSGVTDKGKSILTGKTITLYDGDKPLISAQIDAGLQATFVGVPVSTGTHSFTASIAADDDLSKTTSNTLNPTVVPSSGPSSQ
jgi:hypothetical protein